MLSCRLATGESYVAGNSTASTTKPCSMPPVRSCSRQSPTSAVRQASLLDRAPIVEFLNRKPEMRRDEVQFWCEFSERRPPIWVLCAKRPNLPSAVNHKYGSIL